MEGVATQHTPRPQPEGRSKQKKYIYYVQPQSQACNRAISEYFEELGLNLDTNKRSFRYRGDPIGIWRITLDFLHQLDRNRKSDPAVFVFRAFRHPEDDPSSITLYTLPKVLGTSPVLRQVKRDLGRAIGQYPKIGKKRR